MALIYLLGLPLSHSLSRVMMEAALRWMGLRHRYLPREVKPEELQGVAAELRRRDILGANVTIPYKERILGLLDEVEEEAASIGAVNTILNDGGWLRGFNTDAPAALRSLQETYGSLDGARVVVVGAGGAGRAVCHALAPHVEEIHLLNRTPEKAAAVAEELRRRRHVAVYPHPLSRRRLERVLERANILINATPVGMTPRTWETPIPRDLLRAGLLVFDLIYNPPRTRLLREAEEAGARCLNGVDMLIYQGAMALELWTGRKPPEEEMRRALLRALGGEGR